jgi:heme/copper-type cytochrome/quinol oxidase subunit 3
MIIFWSFIASVVILFGVVLWSYIDDLKKADEYYLSSDDLNKFFENSKR